tara:strand:- start:1879 stop:2472 length:594 start_codon:yes stop_codon:yes gene_type:complete
MEQYKFDESSFMGGWFMPGDLCDSLIEYYHSKEDQHTDGISGGGVDHKVRKNTDLVIYPENFVDLDRYLFFLQECLDKYKEKYEWCDNVNAYSIIEPIKIQHYAPTEGYYTMHMENSGHPDPFILRHLVFMTYLNTLDNAGTEFYYQKLTTECKKGLTLIWPAGWTHVHRGVTNNVSDKYITTGWYSFVMPEEIKVD